MTEKKLLGSAVGASAISLLVAFGTFVLSLWVVRTIPILEISLFASFGALSNVLGLFLGGFQTVITKLNLVGRGRPIPDQEEGVIPTRFLGSLLFVGIALLGFSSVWNPLIGLPQTVVLAVSLTPLISGLHIVFAARLAALGKFVWLTFFSLGGVACNLATQVVWSQHFDATAESVIVITVMINALSVIIGMCLVHGWIISHHRFFNSSNLQVALLALFGAVGTQFDLLFAGLLLEPTDRALYATAGIFAKALIFVFGTANTVLFTLLYRRVLARRGFRKLFVLSTTWTTGLGLLLVAFAMLIGPELMVTLYGKRWAMSAELVPLALVSAFPYLIFSVILVFHLARPKWSTVVFLASVELITFALCVVLVAIPEHLILSFGAMGFIIVIGLLLLGKDLVVIDKSRQ